MTAAIDQQTKVPRDAIKSNHNTTMKIFGNEGAVGVETGTIRGTRRIEVGAAVLLKGRTKSVSCLNTC